MPTHSGIRQHPALLAMGQAIRDTRIEKGLSQEALADLSGVNRGYVGHVERGDNNAALMTLVKLAAALDVPLERLVAARGALGLPDRL